MAKEQMKFDAVILNAFEVDGRIHGRVFCDRSDRFFDGELITTSTVTEHVSRTIVRTRNSLYKVMWAA